MLEQLASKQHFSSQNNLMTTAPSSSNKVVILDTSKATDASASSLVNLNDRLTRQLEDNLSTFESIGRHI